MCLLYFLGCCIKIIKNFIVMNCFTDHINSMKIYVDMC